MQKTTNQIKRNNHVIPRCLLREWITTKDNRQGVYVFEIPKRKISFSSASKQKAFSFAIKDYAYVPKVNNEKTNQVEDWLAGVEGTLAAFITSLKANNEKQVQNGKLLDIQEEGSGLLKTPEEFAKLLIAFFSMHSRSVYDLNLSRKFILDNPDVIEHISPDKTMDIEVAILQNLVNTAIEYASEYTRSDIVILKNEEGNLLASDRPLLLELIKGLSFLIVSPYYCIAIKKDFSWNFRYDLMNKGFAATLNKMVVAQARNWIVAKDEAILKKYIPDCIAEHPNDKHEYKIIKHTLTGFYI